MMGLATPVKKRRMAERIEQADKPTVRTRNMLGEHHDTKPPEAAPVGQTKQPDIADGTEVAPSPPAPRRIRIRDLAGKPK